MSARDASTESGEPGECLACRGTGTLISGLGGTPHEVRCPWCEGTGRRIPGIDAQAHPAEGGTADAGEAEDSGAGT
jgi:DnaJ-class molecular chaperone